MSRLMMALCPVPFVERRQVLTLDDIIKLNLF